MPEHSDTSNALEMQDVHLWRDEVHVLSGVDWTVGPGERWVVLGPNGCGKTTLVRLASGYLHPTSGRVVVLGRRLGRTDVRALRRHIAVVSASITRMVVPRLTARELVVAAARGALEPWWDSYSAEEQDKAHRLLADAGFSHVADREFALLSEGERQQVLLARALMAEPELILLDEPCAGLDMGGRERLLQSLGRLPTGPTAPAVVMVTHHTEEVPPGFTHAMVMRSGRVLAAGPLGTTLTSAVLSDCFGVPLEVHQDKGRWWSRAAS